MTFLNFAKGYKTYATVAVGVALGVAQGMGYDVPTWADWVIGFMGLGFHRMAIQNQSRIVEEQVAVLIKAIEDQITVPSPNPPKGT